jgi:predicted lipid carrier protein YhbT
MIEPTRHPPFRLPPIASLALSPLPLLPLQLLLQGLLASIVQRHPRLPERMQGIHGRCIGIEPTDLPFVLLLEAGRNDIALRLDRSCIGADAVARIRGPILALLGLVDGRYDGDALFFARDITIEGDVEAVLALRNAVDDAEIDLAREVAVCLASLPQSITRAARRKLAGSASGLIWR